MKGDLMYWNQAMAYDQEEIASDAFSPSPDDTGLLQFAIPALAQLGTSLLISKVQKDLGEKQIKLQREIANRQLALEEKITNANVRLINVQTTGLESMQNINIEIATSEKDLVLLENALKKNRLIAQAELELAQKKLMGQAQAPQQSAQSAQQAQAAAGLAEVKILGMKPIVAVSVGIGATGLGIWLLRKFL
jgi:hypothetical protein